MTKRLHLDVLPNAPIHNTWLLNLTGLEIDHIRPVNQHQQKDAPLFVIEAKPNLSKFLQLKSRFKMCKI